VDALTEQSLNQHILFLFQSRLTFGIESNSELFYQLMPAATITGIVGKSRQGISVGG
jgi:hypothetical protein